MRSFFAKMTNKFEQQVIDHIRSYDLISSSDNIIAGVSGGRDSVCLLFLLSKLSREWGFRLFAVHVNHMLRAEEAERDKEFVKNLCRDLKVPCTAVNVDVASLAEKRGISIEEAGRAARFRAFESASKRYANGYPLASFKVALAHHMDDNVETVLLNLARGSGLNCVTGMAAQTSHGNMTVIRPLLCMQRKDIEKYISENALPYVDDSSNFSDVYTRNKIRLNVMPQLQKVNSRACEHINETASALAQIQEYMEKQVSSAMDSTVDIRENSIAIDTRALRQQEAAIQTGIVYKCIGRLAGTLKDISRINVRDVISLMDKQTGRRIELPYNLTAVRSYDNIILRKETEIQRNAERRDYESVPLHMVMDSHVNISLKDIANGGRTFIMADGGTISFSIIEVNDSNRDQLTQKNIYNKVFDCDTIKGSLILSRALPDDEIKFAGGTKTLKKYFTDEKIPWEIRNQLLVLKDVNSTLWVLGYRIGEPYKITERTTRGLKVVISGGQDE